MCYNLLNSNSGIDDRLLKLEFISTCSILLTFANLLDTFFPTDDKVKMKARIVYLAHKICANRLIFKKKHVMNNYMKEYLPQFMSFLYAYFRLDLDMKFRFFKVHYKEQYKILFIKYKTK